MESFFLWVSPYLHEGSRRVKVLTYFLLLGVILLLANYIYESGGTHLPYVHVMYVPLIIAGFWLGFLPGISLAVLAGLSLGPYMPMVTDQDIHQSTESWTIRLFFFVLITFLTCMGAQVVRALLEVQKKQFLVDFESKSRNYKGLEARYKEVEFAAKLRGGIALKLSQARQVEKAFGSDTLAYVMRETKARLKKICGPGVIIGRISLDTFLICVEDDRRLQEFALSIVHHLDKSFRFNDIPFLIEFSQGIAAYNRYLDEGLKQMVKNAMIAVDVAYDRRVDIHVHDENTKDSSDRNIYLMHELREALATDALTLNYQPQIDLRTGQVVGVEALARWNHAKLGMISPLEFTGIAEQTQLINPYTKWLLKKALSHLSAWRKDGLDVTLSLNFSMKNFEDPSVVQEIYGFMKEFNIPPQFLQVEVTETAIAKNIKKAADILHSIRESGVKVAIDDFGTGQSSLMYLFELPVDVIKIDQSFIKSVLDNSAADAIVRSAITMGHEMNLEVVAEGIETQEQLTHLSKLGCDYAQGYFIAKPMPMEMAETWLKTKRDQFAKKKA